MFYNSYLDIQHLDKPAIHPGGLCEFFFAKLEDVEIWPQLNPQTSTYTEEVILRAGASWYRCQVIDPERDYKEESKTAEGGPYVDVRLAGFLPDDSPLNTVTIAGMMLHDYVIVLQERNGMRRLIGNEDAGAKFTHSYDSSDGDGTRGRQLVFTFKSTAPSGIYLSAVTANGDIVNPPWPGGGGPETDPTVPIWVKNITQVQIANWDTAFNWGDHAAAGYLTKVLADGYYSPLGHTHSLAQLTDVNISGLLGNQLLRYDAGAGRWVNWTPDFSPMGHTHNFSELLNIPTTIAGYGITDFDATFDTRLNFWKNVAGGVAALGVDGKLSTDVLPALSTTETYTIASEAAMLALAAQRGDFAVRTDFDPARVFILAGDDPTLLANWVAVSVGGIQTINGKSGANVTLLTTDISEGTNLYFTTARARAAFSAGAGIDISAGIVSVIFGTTAGTVAQGNDSRINNGQTAFSWGNHATAGYELASNKSTATDLGTSNTLYPTQNAVKVYVDAATAGVTRTWQQTLAVSNIATTTPVVNRTPALDAGLYADAHFEARSSTFPAIGFHRPGNAGMALYLGTIDQADLRIRTSSNVDYKIWHDGYAPVPAQTLQQVATAGNETDRLLRVTGAVNVPTTGSGLEMYYESGNGVLRSRNVTTGSTPLLLSASVVNSLSRMLVNGASDDGVTSLQVAGNGYLKNAGGTVGIELGSEPGLNRLISGDATFSNWQPFGISSGGLLVSNRAGNRPPDDGTSALQVNGPIKAAGSIRSFAGGNNGFIGLNTGGLNQTGYLEFFKGGGGAERIGYIGFNSSDMQYVAEGPGNTASHVFLTNSVPRVIIEPAGNVGIGTIAPAASKLDVNGTITAPSLTSPSGDNLFTYANGAPSGAVGTWTTQGLGIGGVPGGTHTERLLVAGNAVATDAWILDGGGVIGEWFLDGGNAAGIRTTSNHPLNFYSSNTLRLQLKADGIVKTWSGVAGNTRVQNTATPFSVQPSDHIILIAGSGTGAGTGVLITLPDPSTVDNQGRELIFIEQTSSSWASNYTLYHGATAPRNDISGNMTLRAVAGQWYITSEIP